MAVGLKKTRMIPLSDRQKVWQTQYVHSLINTGIGQTDRWMYGFAYNNITLCVHYMPMCDKTGY